MPVLYQISAIAILQNKVEFVYEVKDFNGSEWVVVVVVAVKREYDIADSFVGRLVNSVLPDCEFFTRLHRRIVVKFAFGFLQYFLN